MQDRMMKRMQGFLLVGLALLLGIWALFVWWTYDPPVLPLFIDPTTGTVGLPVAGQ